jgi:hypothetical protein
MKCPNCKNVGWQPTADLNKPLKNMGKKEYFQTFITRRYFCFQCGYAFMTKEEFYRPIETKVNQINFLEDV